MGRHSWIAREGQPYIIGMAVLLVLSLFWCPSGLGKNLAVLLFLGVVWFFRNPERIPPLDPYIAVCPADGKVVGIEEVDGSRFLEGRFQRVSIFMNALNVHVNRVPLDGKLVEMKYNPGGFALASSNKASEQNEQNAMIFQTKGGTIIVNQIAGIAVRRIQPYLSIGDEAARGDRLGIIRFGSRVDVYLPINWKIPLKIGQKVVAGETPLAYIG